MEDGRRRGRSLKRVVVTEQGHGDLPAIFVEDHLRADAQAALLIFLSVVALGKNCCNRLFPPRVVRFAGSRNAVRNAS
ncbi:hypothetical protein V0R50_27350 [Pseudomonas sp. 148P]|uniref:Uncharacterized protein n=1 Tax=Pseudomonas ulcerans TaxID=3115852 RepID=A0ABU7HZN8_9PSED|nr:MULTISPECIES: hypothetical protein [unclassified Pseudomonas]MEE1925015.1 hypothetical protein [Pseudomonas sp. 147P]MEE1936956.1 hypothetical protein [Pseudomonas sp. 148P]